MATNSKTYDQTSGYLLKKYLSETLRKQDATLLKQSNLHTSMALLMVQDL